MLKRIKAWLTTPPRNREYRIELFDGVSGPYWRLVHRNGQPLATSEQYSSRSEAEDTAERLAKAANFELRRIR